MQVLNQHIAEKLEEITDIQSVYDHPWGQFEGYPAVTVFPSGNSSDYETTAENLRSYVFLVHLFIDVNAIQKDANGNIITGKAQVKEAYRLIRVLVDKIIDKFDQDETMSGIELPTGKTMINVVPSPSAIELFEQENILVAEMRLECRIVFDVA